MPVLPPSDSEPGFRNTDRPAVLRKATARREAEVAEASPEMASFLPASRQEADNPAEDNQLPADRLPVDKRRVVDMFPVEREAGDIPARRVAEPASHIHKARVASEHRAASERPVVRWLAAARSAEPVRPVDRRRPQRPALRSSERAAFVRSRDRFRASPQPSRERGPSDCSPDIEIQSP